MKWTTKDGASFDIREMGDAHLRNAIDLLSGKDRKRRLMALRLERLRRFILHVKVKESPRTPRVNHGEEIPLFGLSLDGGDGEW